MKYSKWFWQLSTFCATRSKHWDCRSLPESVKGQDQCVRIKYYCWILFSKCFYVAVKIWRLVEERCCLRIPTYLLSASTKYSYFGMFFFCFRNLCSVLSVTCCRGRWRSSLVCAHSLKHHWSVCGHWVRAIVWNPFLRHTVCFKLLLPSAKITSNKLL